MLFIRPAGPADIDAMMELAVLSGTAASVDLSLRAIAKAGDNPDHWLPIFDQMRRAQ